MRRAASIAVLALAALAPSAAAQTWSAPFQVAAPSTYIAMPSIGVDREGRALVAWSFPTDQDDAASLRVSTGLRGISPAGVPAPQRSLPDGLAAAPVLFGRDEVAILSRHLSCAGIAPRVCDRADHVRVTLAAAFGRTAGAPGRARTIDGYVSFAGDPAFAGNRRGQLAVAYAERRPDGGVVWLVERRPGHAFGAPVAVARGHGIGPVAVAVGERGDVLVAYARSGRVYARTRSPGHGLGRPDDVTASGTFLRLKAGIADSGLAAVAVQRNVVGPGPGIPQVTTKVRVAVRTARSSRFGAARPLGSTTNDDGAAPRLAAVPGGSMLLASAVGVTRIAAGGGVVPVAIAQAADDIAVRADGTAVVVAQGVQGRPTPGILASFAAPGGAFGSPELVAAEPGAMAPVATFDPRTGQPLVAWLASGARPQSTVLHAATRAGSCQDSDCG